MVDYKCAWLTTKMIATLMYLGPSEAASEEARLVKPSELSIDKRLPLNLHHQHRWGRTDITRVIVGSDSSWADLELVDEPLTIRKEHVRFYLNHRDPEHSDFRVMKHCHVLINGKIQYPFQWYNIKNRDEIELSVWRFRYEFIQ